MKTWTRKHPLSLPPEGQSTEIWELSDRDTVEASYSVSVTLGKHLDVVRLRGRTPELLKERSAYIASIAAKLYDANSELSTLFSCPCCEAPSSPNDEDFSIYRVAYRRCPVCGHTFVGRQPTKETLNRVFADEEDYSALYRDTSTLDFRMKNIIEPKLNWAQDAYKNHYDTAPHSVLDVGAGGGHFVAGCAHAGLKASGYELNSAATQFAKDALGVNLSNADYLSADISVGNFDIITFWGLLEYTPNPRDFLAQARKQLAKKSGLLIMEVPRVDCFCTAIQKEYPEAIWRHAVPTSHVNLFSDSSTATLLHDSGFKPIAAWYFGLDFYEMLSLFSVELEDDTALEKLERLIAPMQAFLDRSLLVDDIIVAAVPI